VNLTVNGAAFEIDVSPSESLLDLLRSLGFKGVKNGCDNGDCGACAVLIDGRAITSCDYPAAAANGKDIITVEGLAKDGELHPIQAAFLDTGGVQCGFCTPGMMLAALDLLTRVPDPSDDQIREALRGNLCRCTGYVKPVEAVRTAAARMRKVTHG
jgi:aerobic-type carbon monoxide dehydrogenase small subunit (CoxS/CutS family)